MPHFPSGEWSAWAKGRWIGDAPAVAGFSIDTRTLKPGQCYIALRGDRFDGHDFVAQVFKQGAEAVIVSREIPGVRPQCIVPDTRAALTAIARGHRARLPTRFAAITGSVGKTTVKELTADVLGMYAPTARTKGNFNNDIGLPLSLLDVELTDRYGVFELGMSHPGELAPLTELLKPELGAITMIGPVHLEYFQSQEGIAREKASVLQSLPSAGSAFLSAVEPWFPLLQSLSAAPVVSVGLDHDADYRAERRSTHHFAVREKKTGQQTDFIAPLPGDYFVRDALLAIAIGRHLGLSWAAIGEAVKNYRPIHLRWQQTRRFGVEIVNDAYNANPVSMRAALRAFAEMPVGGGRWLVLGGMRELGASAAEEHLQLGRECAREKWRGLVTVGPLGRLIADGAREAGFEGGLYPCPDHAEAALILGAYLRPDDAMLLKGSRGERMEDVLKEWNSRMEKEAAHHEQTGSK